MRRFERMRARRCAVQARENVGDFNVDLAKAGVNQIETLAGCAYLLLSASPFQFEKADPEIGLVSGNLRIRAASQRPQIGKSS